MSTHTVTLTHRGWVGLCPVLIGRPYSDEPILDTSCRLLEWWLLAQLAIFDLINSMMAEPVGYPIRITGRLETPVTVEYEEGE